MQAQKHQFSFYYSFQYLFFKHRIGNPEKCQSFSGFCWAALAQPLYFHITPIGNANQMIAVIEIKINTFFTKKKSVPRRAF